MSKPWGGIGAWAAEAEREEAEEKEEAAAAAAAAAAAPSQSFPSLKESVSAKPKKKKTVMSLAAFTTGGYVGPGDAARRDAALALESKGLTPAEMLRLPTGPKERTAEEMQQGRLGGGFSSYGRSGGGPPSRRDNDQDGSWGGGRRSYGGFDDDRRDPTPRASDFDQPSRADEVDNWAMGKKPLPSLSGDSSGRTNRYGSLGGGSGGGGGGGSGMGGGGGGFSRADEVDSWAMGKKPLPVRSSTFGSGFRDSGPEPDRWAREGPLEGNRERPRLVLDKPSGDVAGTEPVKTNRPNPFGAARPREEVLTEKGLDWKKLDSEIEAKKTSRPTSAHSSRPSSAQSSRSEGPVVQSVEAVVKPRPKVNPFGDAKPREVLLEEKGKDWRKIDRELEHRGIARPEIEEEKILKEEIDQLKKKLENEVAAKANGESLQGPDGDQSSLQDTILRKEKDLELLIRELDDKVRFGQKAIERPGSGAGRVSSFSERPPSQSGPYEDSRSMEFMDRPRSRGTGDVWSRSGDDRRGFQGGRERGFLGNRDMDRSRDRW